MMIVCGDRQDTGNIVVLLVEITSWGNFCYKNGNSTRYIVYVSDIGDASVRWDVYGEIVRYVMVIVSGLRQDIVRHMFCQYKLLAFEIFATNVVQMIVVLFT